MCRKTSIHQSPNQWDQYNLSSPNSIGDLFREYGEEYISIYKPDKQKIKLIRSIRVCKTPALGGVCYTCKKCKKQHYIYKSCGNSQCMICQSIKREQWVDKLKNKLLKVPYVHVTFTLPHQLNGLARLNQKLIYAMIIKASWLTIQEVMTAINATAGMTAVLHTFGSDMKYHIHTHCLVTFGGLNTQGKWQYPTDKYKIAKYRIICATFKRIFMHLLEQAYQNNEVIYHEDYRAITKELVKLRWVVNSTRPTMDTSLIEKYLARYINRIAVSNNRLKYIIKTKEVVILYNDYKQQKTGEAAPKAIKNLTPLVAIDQILQHVLPRHFQKSRHFGLHHPCNKLKSNAEEALKNNSNTIRTLFEIITHLMGLEKMKCSECQSQDFDMETILPNQKFIQQFLSLQSNKSPPTQTQYITSHPINNKQNAPTSRGQAMCQN